MIFFCSVCEHPASHPKFIQIHEIYVMNIVVIQKKTQSKHTAVELLTSNTIITTRWEKPKSLDANSGDCWYCRRGQAIKIKVIKFVQNCYLKKSQALKSSPVLQNALVPGSKAQTWSSTLSNKNQGMLSMQPDINLMRQGIYDASMQIAMRSVISVDSRCCHSGADSKQTSSWFISGKSAYLPGAKQTSH